MCTPHLLGYYLKIQHLADGVFYAKTKSDVVGRCPEGRIWSNNNQVSIGAAKWF